MAFSLAAALGLIGSASAQAPETPALQQPGDYKLLRGQSLQLKKPANAVGINMVRTVGEPVAPAPVLAPIQTTNVAPSYIPTVAVPRQVGAVSEVRYDYLPPAGDAPKADPATGLGEYKVKTDLPTPDELYRLDSEVGLQARIRKEYTAGEQNFPQQAAPSNGRFTGRAFQQGQIVAEASYVCHGKLLFEEKNAERYGWDLGFIQPVVSTAYFLKDVTFLPYHLASRPHNRECSPRCLPGDQVPYLIYHEGFTLSGFLGETGVALALALIVFP